MTDNDIFLKHIFSAIEEIEKYTIGVTQDDFQKNTEKQSAVIRQFEIIGEAAKNLSDDFKKDNPIVVWLDVASMRDNLIHEYFGVDLKIVWKTVKEDLPTFKQQIESFIASLQKSDMNVLILI